MLQQPLIRPECIYEWVTAGLVKSKWEICIVSGWLCCVAAPVGLTIANEPEI